MVPTEEVLLEVEWEPCGRAYLQTGNAEYQKEMLEQSRKDMNELFMSHWGCQ